MLGHALVDTFISAADQQDLIQLRIRPRRRLIELAALRRHQNNLLPRRFRRPDRFHRFKERPRFEQHAFTAAKRPVIHGAMPIVRPIAQIVYRDLDQTVFPRALNDAVLERPPEKFREDRQHVKFQGSSNNPSGSTTRICFDSMSISRQNAFANGIRISRPSSPATFSNGALPYSSIPFTTPIGRSPTTVQPIRSAYEYSPGS